MKLFSIETNAVKLDGGSMFGNAPKMLWQKWMIPDERNRIHLSCRALLLMKDDGRNVLFEAGAGPFFEPKQRDRYGITPEHQLLASLKTIGLDELDIHAIVLSHLHFDHAGGLLSPYEEGPLRLLFPNAKYYVGKEHWAYANHPHRRELASFIPSLQALLEASGRLILVDDTGHPDLDFCRFHVSNGHTVGLLMAELDLLEGPLVYASDVIPGVPWLHLPITMGYDRFAALMVDEKQKLLEKLSKENGFLFFTHDPHTACVQVLDEGNGKYTGNPFSL